MEKNRNNVSYTNEEASDLIHQVANLYTSTKKPHDYGTGEEYTSIEVHTLQDIYRLPQVTVTDLAARYGKTKGAVSQIIKKLETKGLITRTASGENDNRCFFQLTEKGLALNTAHGAYDTVHGGEVLDLVREQVSEEDFNTAFRVMSVWLEVRREVHQKRIQSRE